jgi:hypothetical protein
MKERRGSDMNIQRMALFFLFAIFTGMGFAQSNDPIYLHLECSPPSQCIDLAYESTWGRAITMSLNQIPAMALAKEDIKAASVHQALSSSTQEILLELKEEKSNQLGEVTAKNIRKKLAIVYRNSILTAPVINAAINDGKISIYGDLGFVNRLPWFHDVIAKSKETDSQSSRQSVVLYIALTCFIMLAAIVYIFFPKNKSNAPQMDFPS